MGSVECQNSQNLTKHNKELIMRAVKSLKIRLQNKDKKQKFGKSTYCVL